MTYQNAYAMKTSNALIAVLSVALILLLAINANAQGMGEIRGTVTDSLTGAPLADVIISMKYKGGIKQEFTDATGAYAIKPLEPGTYDLTFSLLGRTPQQVVGVTVGTGGLIFVDKQLGTGKTLTGIEVYANKIDMKSDPVHITLDKDIIRTTAGDRGIGGVIGVTIPTAYIPERSNKIGFRGSRTDATQYYVDGVKVIGELNIPQMGIDQVTVITGGLPAQYGDATGGVVLITTGSFK